ncbi:oligosaccharide flippase family protein [Macrococcoides bohemicum]|uniref:oligosaccharide flippase family protein n=1 Tax=Macrococcoides bohemicum TaxID=1903056 RepID=UPI001C5E2FB5|nr:oligosaccharide flippase family protein [Macrococcus bohemicus]QYA44587.1 oligosaccharide flippase family protein [Macrococcus bohemicus]
MKKNAILVFVRNIIIMFLGLLISILIARSLGPDKQGEYALFTLIPTIIYNLGNLGIGSSLIYLVNSNNEKKYEYLNMVLKIIYLLSMLNTLFGGILMYLYFNYSNIDINFKEMLILYLLIPILFLNNILINFFQALKMYKYFSTLSIIPKLIQLILLIGIILFDTNTVLLTIMTFLISNFISIILSLSSIYKVMEKIPKSNEKINVREIFEYGLKNHLANTITFVNYRFDQFMLGIFTNTYQIGIYNIAIIIVEKIWAITTPITTVLFPELSSIKAKDERLKITTKVTRILFVSNIILGLLCYAFMPIFIKLIFGKEYIQSIEVINILLIGILLMSIDKIISNDFASIGKAEINLRVTNITFIINMVLGFILIPTFGMKGAAFSTTISYIVTFFMKIKVFKKYNDLKYSDIFLLTKKDLLFLKDILKKD